MTPVSGLQLLNKETMDSKTHFIRNIIFDVDGTLLDSKRDIDTELFQHWFHSFAGSAGITLHAECLYGENNHHVIESLFKGLARALRQAVELDPRKGNAIPSTKGTLGG